MLTDIQAERFVKKLGAESFNERISIIEKYKKRSSQEWKNGEMKRFHGMARARGWGLRSMTLQVKLTSIAVNLKRIAALVGGKNLKYSFKIRIFSYKNMFNLNNYETG